MRLRPFYWGGWFLTRVVSKLFFRIKTQGQENIPRQGGFILASNHISNYDPPLVGSWITREVYFLAKEELFRNPVAGGLITRTNALPVKRGAMDRKAIHVSVEVIRRGFGLTFFPEGTRSKTDQFLRPKAGIGMIATRAKCPIVPAYVHGSNHPGDCFKGRQRLSITYGEPFGADWVMSFPKGKEGYEQIASAVMERIGQIKASVVASE